VVDRVVSLVHRERLLAQAREERTRATHLERALESSREIGTALGILMANQKCRTDEAFEQLRQASQTSHRKVREIALDIIDTGVLDVRT
jgi:AmiR/NasT family two-component response regulator